MAARVTAAAAINRACMGDKMPRFFGTLEASLRVKCSTNQGTLGSHLLMAAIGFADITCANS